MAKPDHILIIRLSAMGDVAMTVPVLRVFTATYPYIKVTVVSKPFFKPLFEEFPDVAFFSAEIRKEHKGISGIFRLARELENEGINTVADLHNVLRSKLLAAYFRVRGMSVAQIDKGRVGKKALVRPKNKVFKQLPTTFQRYAKVFENLNLPIDLEQHQFPKPKQLPPKLLPIVEDTAKIKLGIAPFAAFKGKEYPLELTEEVIKMMDQSGEVQIFLFGGGASEIEKLKKIALKYDSVTNMAGVLSFQEELSLISNLDTMVAMDSGNAHLAAIYNVPVITLWGVTHPYAGFYPFKQTAENALLADREKYPLIPTSIYGNKAPAGYEKAMQTITPDEVVAKIKEVIFP